MVTNRTLRRKLQKKRKHKPWRGWCSQCGERNIAFILVGNDRNGWHLHKRCKTSGCGYCRELLWSGGGTGRHIP